jgi:hypothetical protein
MVACRRSLEKGNGGMPQISGKSLRQAQITRKNRFDHF